MHRKADAHTRRRFGCALEGRTSPIVPWLQRADEVLERALGQPELVRRAHRTRDVDQKREVYRRTLFGREGLSLETPEDGFLAMTLLYTAIIGCIYAVGAVATALAMLLDGTGSTVRLLTAGGAPLDVTIEGRPASPTRAHLTGHLRECQEQVSERLLSYRGSGLS